jgi:hypothetical protein
VDLEVHVLELALDVVLLAESLEETPVDTFGLATGPRADERGGARSVQRNQQTVDQNAVALACTPGAVSNLALARVVYEVLLRRKERSEELVRFLAVTAPCAALFLTANLFNEESRFRQKKLS